VEIEAGTTVHQSPGQFSSRSIFSSLNQDNACPAALGRAEATSGCSSVRTAIVSPPESGFGTVASGLR